MKITKIEASRKKRFKIYLDDVYAFSVSQATLVKFALLKGSTIHESDILKIQADDAYQQAYQKALHFLHYQLRTTKEVYEKLEKLGYDDDLIHQILQQLTELELINDEHYAESFLNENFVIQKKGPKAIAFELNRKGISKAVIERVLKQYDVQQQQQLALEVGEKYAERQTHLSIKAIKQKTYVYLMQRGYAAEIASMVTSQLELLSQDDEVEIALKEAKKQYDRLRKTKQDQQLWYALKGKLFQKGFETTTIEVAIERLQQECEEWI